MSLRAKQYTLHSGPLTDDKIFAYMLEGWYGSENKRWAERKLKEVNRLRRSTPRPTFNPLKELSDLGL